MSSLTSVYTSLPSLYPCTFAAAFPPSFPLSHPIHSAQHPPPRLPPPSRPPNSLFLFDLPSLQGWLLPKRGEQSGTWNCLRHSHFQCHKFQFPIFLPFFSPPVLQPPSSSPPPPSLMAYPSWEFVNSVSLCLSLSFILTPSLQTPIGYYPVSCLPQTSATQNAIFPRPHLWWDPNERSLIFCSKRNGVVSPILNIVISLPVLVCHWDALSHLHHIRGMQMITFFSVTAPPPSSYMCACVCAGL